MKATVIAFLLIFGLSIAGSDGPWFPWGNFAGVVMVWLAGWMSERYLAEPAERRRSIFTISRNSAGPGPGLFPESNGNHARVNFSPYTVNRIP